MKKIIRKDDLIKLISERSNFNLGDSREFLDVLISIFEDIILQNWELNIRGFGKLAVWDIKSRLGSDGQTLPPTKRVIFTLSKNLRNLVKNKK